MFCQYNLFKDDVLVIKGLMEEELCNTCTSLNAHFTKIIIVIQHPAKKKLWISLKLWPILDYVIWSQTSFPQCMFVHIYVGICVCCFQGVRQCREEPPAAAERH